MIDKCRCPLKWRPYFVKEREINHGVSIMKRQLIFIFLLGTVLSSCAFGDRRVLLDYQSSLPSLSGAATVKQEVVVLPFQDERAEKFIIGDVRNNWGMKTADVLAKNDVTTWITQAVENELGRAGFQVRHEGAEDRGEALQISGSVLRVYCTAMLSYEAEIQFQVKVEKTGKEVMTKVYSGGGGGGLNFAMTSKSYGEALNEALSRAVRSFVNELQAVV